MAYYRVCPNCGCNLDPNEKCDCQREKEQKQDFFRRHLKIEPGVGQFAFVFDGRRDRIDEKSGCKH